MNSLLPLMLVLSLVTSVDAQTIFLKSGQTVVADSLARDGDMVTIGITTPSGSKGKLAYHVSDIDKLVIPPPPALAGAAQLEAKGQTPEALELIRPLVDFQKTIRDIPGNWWARAALLESSLLGASQQIPEAQALLGDIASFSKEPDIQIATKLQLALLVPPKAPAEALAAYHDIIEQSTEPHTLTEAWIAEGDVHFAQHEFDDALLAYLTVPVFYSDHNPLLPRALWGVARSYGKIKDFTNQQKTLNDLVAGYPDAPEATLARTELKIEALKKEEN